MGNKSASGSFRTTVTAILFAVTGWTFFVVTDTLSKWLTQDYGVSQIIAITSFTALALTGPWIVYRYGARALLSPYLKWHGVMAVTVCGLNFFVINALARIPLADFYGIIFLAPLVMCLLAGLILRERIGVHRMIAVIIGFGGVLVLARPQYGTLNVGILFALAAVSFVAMNAISVRKMQGETVTPLFIFFPALLNTLVHTPLMLADFHVPDFQDTLLFIAFAPALLTAQVCYAIGFKKIPETAILAPFHYVQLVWGIAFGYVLFGDIPSVQTLCGAALIIGAGLYAIRREHMAYRRGESEL